MPVSLLTPLETPELHSLFQRGNYARVAMQGNPDDWRTFVAAGLCGQCRPALRALEAFDAPEIAFYRAVIYWIDGQTDQAIRLLKDLPDAHSKTLLALIRKPQIRVLGQLLGARTGTQDLLSGILRDSHFRVENISFYPNDLRNEPYLDILQYVDPEAPPDFFVCEMLEWHVVPPNIRALPCPTFGQTSDYDVHIHYVHPLLAHFDELVASDPMEWDEVGGLAGHIPISTFPKVFGVPDDMVSPLEGPRILDVLFTGALFQHYWPEKTKAIHEILKNPNINARLLNGVVPQDLYHRMLGTSRLTANFLRRPAIMPTRALESLAMGCATLLQKESVLRLYVSEDEGALPFDGLPDLVQRTQYALQHWPRIAAQAQQGAHIVREEFQLSRVASQYFRYLTFLAARPRPARAGRIAPIVQKRLAIGRGWMPKSAKDLAEIRKATLHILLPQYHRQPTPGLANDILREVVLHAAGEENPKAFASTNATLFRGIFEICRQAVAQFPQDLVLKFNFMRALLHLGNDVQHAQAIFVARSILSESQEDSFVSRWILNPTADVGAWDLYERWFDYRRYNDLVTAHLSRGDAFGTEALNILMSSICAYVGVHTSEVGLLREAVRLNPTFAAYRLFLAEHLARSPVESEWREAADLLIELMEGTVVFETAEMHLQALLQRQTLMLPRAHEPLRCIERIKRFSISPSTIQAWFDNHSKQLVPYFRPVSQRAFHSIPGDGRVMDILIPDPLRSDIGEVLHSISGQTSAERVGVILARPSLEDLQPISDVLRRVEVAVTFVQVAAHVSFGEALERCLELSGAPLQVLALPGMQFVPHGIELLASTLLQSAEVQAVAGDFLHIRPDSATATRLDDYYASPDCSSQALFTTVSPGPFVAWKRDALRVTAPPMNDDWMTLERFWVELGIRGGMCQVMAPVGTWNKPRAPVPSSREAQRVRSTLWPAWRGECPSFEALGPIPYPLLHPEGLAEARTARIFNLVEDHSLLMCVWYLGTILQLARVRDFPMMQAVLEMGGQMEPRFQTFPRMLKVLQRHLALSQMRSGR